MPPLTRWFIKSALLYFVGALVIGALLSAQTALHLSSAITALVPVYFHLFMLGWITQLIFGVSYWMFPRFTKEQPRGSLQLGIATYATLNVGLLLRAVAEPMQALRPDPLWAWTLGLSAFLLWTSGMLYVVNTWGRVKER